MEKSVSRQLSNKVLAELYGKASGDPFLMLVTLSHSGFAQDVYLVDNNEEIVSRGNTYIAFPMDIILPVDDGTSERNATITFDNVSLELIDEIRTPVNPIDCKIELILASDPEIVELAYEDFKIFDVNYNKNQISARLFLDDFLNTEVSSERYAQSNFPGLFE